MDIFGDNQTVGVDISDMPNIEKMVSVKGKKAERLADLHLHLVDLNFAEKCLNNIEAIEDYDIKIALWKCAVIHYTKCFTSGQRSKLNADKILSEQPASAKSFHKAMISLRNKNIAHDENPFSQSFTAALILKKGMQSKIDRILNVSYNQDPPLEGAVPALKLSIKVTKSWIDTESNELKEKIHEELEKLSHDQLLSNDPVKLYKVGLEEITKNKKEFFYTVNESM